MLARNNLAPNIKNLLGELEFTSKYGIIVENSKNAYRSCPLLSFIEEELFATQKILDGYGVVMPNFTTIGSSLQKELNEDSDLDLDPDFRFKKIDIVPFGLNDNAVPVKTPELIVEESDSEEEGSPQYYAPMLRQLHEPKRRKYQ